MTISGVCLGTIDAYGLRVDERGAGNILFTASNSTLTGVGADGVELDEGQNGIVRATVVGSAFNGNGGYCDPVLLSAELETFLAGTPDEAEFSEAEQVSSDSLPGPVVGSSDDRCFEFEVSTYESGFVEEYGYGIDTDDGFDIDEAGNGTIKTVIVDTQINDNLDEGIDFDEEDAGGIDVVFFGTTASGNSDDGYKMSEQGVAGVIGIVGNATATDNGGKGFVFEEEDDGNVTVFVANTETSNNDDSDDTGIEVVQEDEGSGRLTVTGSGIADGNDLDGVELVSE